MLLKLTRPAVKLGALLRTAVPCLICVALGSSCTDPESEDDGATSETGEPTDGQIAAKIFEVDLQVDSFDTSDPDTPQFSSSASMLFGTFPIDPEAVSYTATFERADAPATNSEGMWDAGARVAEIYALGPDIVPGYDENGIVGGEYFLWLTGSGCQSGAGGSCAIGGESPMIAESTLRDVRTNATLTITIAYQ